MDERMVFGEPILKFLRSTLRRDPGGFVPTIDLLELLEDYERENNLFPYRWPRLLAAIGYCFHVDETRETFGDKTDWGFRGVSLTEDARRRLFELRLEEGDEQ